jgi:hypothetical protein
VAAAAADGAARARGRPGGVDFRGPVSYAHCEPYVSPIEAVEWREALREGESSAGYCSGAAWRARVAGTAAAAPPSLLLAAASRKPAAENDPSAEAAERGGEDEGGTTVGQRG